jgi:hypothetical protein
MRILYALRSSEHFSYQETIIRELCLLGHSVHFIYDKKWSKSTGVLQNGIETIPNFFLYEFIYRKNFWRPFIFFMRELRSYASYLKRKNQSNYYLRRWYSYQPYWLKRLIYIFPVINKWISSKALDKFFPWFEGIVPPDRNIVESISKLSPDVVIVSPINLRFSEEVEYIKAAKKMGIPTVGIVLSWDNLTTKGLFHIIPDMLLAWNQAHMREAVEVHHVPEDKIVITGAPVFDKWFGINDLLLSRRDFCSKVGLNWNSPYIVYLGSSKNIARDETWLVAELGEALSNSSLPHLKEMQILVRPHPANAEIYQSVTTENIVVWPKEGSLPYSMSTLQDFYNTLKHSVATVGINTSGMIDAIINDIPGIAFVTDKYQETQQQAVHFKHLSQAKALEEVMTVEECLQAISAIYRGEDLRKDARKHFIHSYIRPCGLETGAGKISALAVDRFVSSRNIPENII